MPVRDVSVAVALNVTHIGIFFITRGAQCRGLKTSPERRTELFAFDHNAAESRSPLRNGGVRQQQRDYTIIVPTK
jgi:hypothetical protein